MQDVSASDSNNKSEWVTPDVVDEIQKGDIKSIGDVVDVDGDMATPKIIGKGLDGTVDFLVQVRGFYDVDNDDESSSSDEEDFGVPPPPPIRYTPSKLQTMRPSALLDVDLNGAGSDAVSKTHLSNRRKPCLGDIATDGVDPMLFGFVPLQQGSGT